MSIVHFPHRAPRRPMATRPKPLNWFQRMWRQLFGNRRKASRAKLILDRVRRYG